MCVILTAERNRLTDAMIDRAVAANADGIGMAWIDAGGVEFRRGLRVSEAKRMAASLPLPYVFHARIATVGGVRPELCHPFPLDRRLNPNQLSGRSSRGVLFHNGHWGEWREFVEPTADGFWSDTRGMAGLVATYGDRVITEVVGDSQRVVLLTVAGVQRYGRGWSQTSKGIWASNTGWCHVAPPLVRRAPSRRLLAKAEFADVCQRRLATIGGVL